jgi:hypothetical protein
MAEFNLEHFRANFKDGARGYLFYVKPQFPANIGSNANRAIYLVKSSSLPASTLEEINVPWQGYDYKLAGKYTFDDWTVTFNCDAEADIYTWYMGWQKKVHDPTSNEHGHPDEYMVDQIIQLLNRSGQVVLQYKLVNAWPSSIGAMELSYDSTEVASFEVTFKYMYHVIDRITYGNRVSFADTAATVASMV